MYKLPMQKHMSLVSTLLVLLSAAISVLARDISYYRYDGSGNNEANPLWGAVDQPMLRHQVPADYADGKQSMTGPEVSPRLISIRLMTDVYPAGKDRGTNHSDLLTYIGQFYDHDFDLTPGGDEPAPIPIPQWDPFYDPEGKGNLTMGFTRSAFVNDSNGVRQQYNHITAYLDGSVIYGSQESKARSLRAMTGGLMKLDADNNLPVNVLGLEMANDANIHLLTQIRAAGDKRQNVNPPQLAITTVWVREHNRKARELAAQHPTWTDDELYTRARQWTTAYIQAVCYYEYLPQLGIFLNEYHGYDASVNPTIDNFFATVAYRYGHAKVTDVIMRVDDEGKEIPQGHLLLQYSYFNPQVSLSAGVEPILRGMMIHNEGVVEPRFATAIQNNLFGLAGINGTDLFSRNVQRGRDHGIPRYNKCRQAMGLQPAATWNDVTADPIMAAILASVYASPDDCDPYVCGLAERKVSGSHFGELFHTSMADQYRRIRDGDFFYFENTDNKLFTEDEIRAIKTTGFRDIILRNTNIKVLPENIWSVDPENPWPTNNTAAMGQRGKSASFKNGRYTMQWAFETVQAVEYIRFSVTVQGTGWVGLGVAQDLQSKMVGADIMIISVPANGQARVDDYYATTLGVPSMDVGLGGTNNVQLISAVEQDGFTIAEFRRPLQAHDSYDRAISKSSPVPFIYAWHPTSDALIFHGANAGRVILDLTGGNSTELGTGNDDYHVGRVHGILMSVAWALLFPLGALFGRAINMQFIEAQPSMRVIILYIHIFFQMAAAAIATASFIYAFRKFSGNVKVDNVPHHHAAYGIAIMAIMYIQAISGFIRPHDSKPNEEQSFIRKAWEVFHHLIGRSVIFLAIVNVGIGMYILTTKYGADAQNWIALVAAAFVCVAVLQAYLDRCERQFVRGKLNTEEPAAKGKTVQTIKAEAHGQKPFTELAVTTPK